MSHTQIKYNACFLLYVYPSSSEKVRKDILWRQLQTLKYGFLRNDTIELLLIILGMMMVLWFCRRMALFLGYVCCSLLGWIVCLQIILNTGELGWLILNHCFPGSKTKVSQCLWFNLIVVERERERKHMWHWGFQVKNIKIFVLFFQIFMCLKFFKIKSWEKIGSQHIKVNSQQIHVC